MIKRPIDSNIAKNIKAFGTEILPEVMGRFFVLATFLSKSRSIISLIMQPAERIIKEPIRNKIVTLKISRLKF